MTKPVIPYQTLFEIAPVATVVTDAKGIFVQLNAAACKLFGHDEASFLGKSIYDVLSPYYLQDGREKLEALVSGVLPKMEIHSSFVTKEGEKRFAVLKSIPYQEEDEVYILSQLVDVTQYTQAHKALEENELNHKNQEARLAQMNPHFIYNALSSVQNFIIQNDKKQANTYIVRLAKFMRQALGNMEQHLVSLEDELEALSNYLELEQMRFDQRFDFDINIAPSVDKHKIKMPVLLLQPFVENAVWHGFAQLPHKGKLSIDLKANDAELEVEISDNGIGRAAAAKHMKKAHMSGGTLITEKRLELFSKKYKKEHSLKVIDLTEGDKAAGTRVEIKLPLIS